MSQRFRNKHIAQQKQETRHCHSQSLEHLVEIIVEREPLERPRGPGAFRYDLV